MGGGGGAERSAEMTAIFSSLDAPLPI
jgi:hypothetical protein